MLPVICELQYCLKQSTIPVGCIREKVNQKFKNIQPPSGRNLWFLASFTGEKNEKNIINVKHTYL